MTSQISLRACSLLRTLASRYEPLAYRISPIPHIPTILQARNAGHAKWQNIAKTKTANDMNKAKVFSRYVLLVRRAVISGGRQPDPKLNGKLNDVLTEASKFNIPKATLERAIARAMNVKILNVNIEIQGPGGSVLIARCETENPGLLRRDFKKLLKKFDAGLASSDTLISMFQSRGFIRTACKTKDQRDVNQDYAEEAAIHANAEDVSLEVFEDAQDEELSKMWVFQTDANSLNQCKGELEKAGLKVISSDLELVPYRAIDFGEEVLKQVREMIQILQDHEQVIDVFHNVLIPERSQDC